MGAAHLAQTRPFAELGVEFKTIGREFDRRNGDEREALRRARQVATECGERLLGFVAAGNVRLPEETPFWLALATSVQSGHSYSGFSVRGVLNSGESRADRERRCVDGKQSAVPTPLSNLPIALLAASGEGPLHTPLPQLSAEISRMALRLSIRNAFYEAMEGWLARELRASSQFAVLPELEVVLWDDEPIHTRVDLCRREKEAMHEFRHCLVSACVEACEAIDVLESPRDGSDLDVQYVTLDQIAAISNRSKRTLEKYLKAGKLPQADRRGGGGRASFWRWDRIRARLLPLVPRVLPVQFPGDRILPPS